MDELARKVGVARKGLAPEKDEAWLDKLGRDFQVRRRSRARARRVSWGIACVATVAMAVLAVGKLRRDTSSPPMSPPTSRLLSPRYVFPTVQWQLPGISPFCG